MLNPLQRLKALVKRNPIDWLFWTILIIFVALMLAGCTTAPGQITSSAATTVAEPTIPEPTNYVVDAANVLSPQVEAELNQKLKDFDSKAQIAVLTVTSTQPWDEKQYGIKLAEKWKVGHKGKDDGVIFLLVTGDRKVRIEVGHGAEAQINDSKAGRILDQAVVPFLKKNDWEGGTKAAVEAIMKEMN